jgi:hypothetical protein
MTLFDYISVPVFVASFLVGLLLVHFGTLGKKTVKVFPTPDSLRRYQYKDNVGNCFTYGMRASECGDKPVDIPVQSAGGAKDN